VPDRLGAVAGVALGLVFLAAGAAKRSSPNWPEQARQLGVPNPVSSVVPWAELVVGALLLTGVARRPVAGVAGGLVLGFSALLAIRIAQGRRPPCACFGRRSVRPIGPWSLIRNAGFLALAIVAVVA